MCAVAVVVYAPLARAGDSPPNAAETSGEAERGRERARPGRLQPEAPSLVPSSGGRAPAEGVAQRMQLVMPGSFGPWATVPPHLGPMAVPLVGGEASLTSQLSLVLEGVRDPFDLQFSGAASGLRWHFLPPDAPLRLSVAGGVLRDLLGASQSWGQLDVARDFGRWHFAGALRLAAAIAGATSPTLVTGYASVSFDVSARTRIGVDYAVEQGAGTRVAIIPWVRLYGFNEKLSLRLAAAVPTATGGATTIMLSLVGDL
jgi:hypothetical protein